MKENKEGSPISIDENEKKSSIVSNIPEIVNEVAELVKLHGFQLKVGDEMKQLTHLE